MKRHFLLALALAAGLASPVAAAPNARLDRLKADLLAGNRSATEVLTQWCGDFHFASPAVIHAEKTSGPGAMPLERVRALLHADAKTAIRHRRVRLMCGSHLMSEADNWYLPERLTPEMNRQLDTTDTSFGTVVRPLNFHRLTLQARPSANPRTALEIIAVLIAGTGLPFSLVVEDYSRELATNGPGR